MFAAQRGHVDRLERLVLRRNLQRALERWQPNYLKWWAEMGPEGSHNFDVYLRTAISADASGWAHFDYVKMPDYRWGIFLAAPEESRTVNFGEHKGEPTWQEVLGREYEPWDRPHLVVDTARVSPAEALAELRSAFEGAAPRGVR